MWGEYLRVTRGELERAVKDPDWALEYAEQVQDTEEEAELSASEARHFRTQCWDVLGFLFRRADFRVDVVHGEEPFAEAGSSNRADDRPSHERCNRRAFCGEDRSRRVRPVVRCLDCRPDGVVSNR
jgi:hypothetical protein